MGYFTSLDISALRMQIPQELFEEKSSKEKF